MINFLKQSIEPYLERRIIISLIMGFVSGLPLLLTITLLQAWLTDENISKSTIGLFALIGLPYSLKFLWAPLFDRYVISALGRRRGWLLLSQIFLISSIFLLGQSQPSINLYNVALLSLAVTFFSASQDIVIDAYRRESLRENEQTIGASAYVLGYRFGALAAGAGGLILADIFSYSFVYSIMASIMILGVVTTLLSDEPEVDMKPYTLGESIIEPFKEFFTRFTSRSSELKILTVSPKNGYNPSWSPDGKRIVFLSDRERNMDIYVMNADGSEQKRLANNSISWTSPSWSPLLKRKK